MLLIRDLSERQISRQELQKKSYLYFQPWNCNVTLGDEKEVFAAKIKYALDNANKVNNLTDLVGRVSSDDINMSGTKAV